MRSILNTVELNFPPNLKKLSKPNTATLLITHYQRLLNEITPNFVHVMSEGKILRTGGRELAIELEKSGYDWIEKDKNLKEVN